MTRQLDIDRVLEDWLAEGPSRLPDRVVAATVDRLDDIPQRRPRLPWSPTMNRYLTYAAGLAAALVAAVAAWSALGGDLGPAAAPLDEFVSPRHGYSVRLPAGEWTHEFRTGTWELFEFFDPNTNSGVDYYERPWSARPPALYVYIASQEVPADWTFEQWTASHDAATEATFPCFDLVGDFEMTKVDGETARVGVHRCEDFEFGRAWTTVQTMFIHDGRGYALYVWPQVQGDLMPSVEDLEAESAAWLSRFTFDR